MKTMKATFIATLASLVWVATARAEEPGSWRFSDDTKPVKVIVLGGSVSAYPAGGYGQWLPNICTKIEVQNRAKEKLGAAELRQRFIAQVLKNRRLDLKSQGDAWLVFLGGMNSVGSPESTNLEVAKTLALAKEAGLHTMALTLNPWGAEDDRRWQGVDGLAYFDHTQKTVDFLLGRLTPVQAFGAANVKGLADATRFAPGQLPDVAVDLWSKRLRHSDAPLRDTKKLEKAARSSKLVKARLAGLAEAERAPRLAALIAQAAELPRWFMKPEFIGFDPIHPTAQGHKEIARGICEAAPASWGCDCGRLDRLAWDRRKNQPAAL